jgi:hypothetical protein
VIRKGCALFKNAVITSAALLMITAVAIASPELSYTPPTGAVRLDPDAHGWSGAAHAVLGWDFAYGRRAAEPATVQFTMDSAFVYVLFTVNEPGGVTATQLTNDQGDGVDDEASVYLWPGGINGFEYRFSANPLGTRFQSSSENTQFSPVWAAKSTRYNNRYVLFMQIPRSVLHGNDQVWRVQFAVSVKRGGSLLEWAHAAAQTSVDQAVYAGTLNSALAAKGKPPAPRVQPYVLGGLGSRAMGGDTSRIGLDASVPIASAGSFYFTLHPDYSNVELDQQTIAPTEFARQYSEVRPFFTQGSGLYDQFTCLGCLFLQLYTPSIPTPRDGFALEGKLDDLSIAGFDSIGDGRTDLARTVSYTNPSNSFTVTTQQVEVFAPGIADDSTETSARLLNTTSGIGFYSNVGTDAGSAVSNSDDARYEEGGVFRETAKSFLGFALQGVGSQFAPVDAFITNNGVDGYNVNGMREFDFSKNSPFSDVVVNGVVDRYQGLTGLRQADNEAVVSLNTKKLVSITATTSSDYAIAYDGVLHPFDQNGVAATVNSGTSVPSTLSYNRGAYGDGSLTSWQRRLAFRIGSRLTCTAELDSTNYFVGSAMDVQWLERAGVTYALGPTSSVTIGIRRITGVSPPSALAAPEFVDASNVAMAYYKRFNRVEVYSAYGDPNALYTSPVFIMKLIFYAGAEKGS